MIFFVSFERLISVPADALATRTHLPHKTAVGLVALLLLAALVTTSALAAVRIVHLVAELRRWLPERIESLRELPLYQELRGRLPDADKVLEGARQYAASALAYLEAFGHVVLYSIIGFILAVVFSIERKELDEFVHRVSPTSLAGTMLRWLHHIADALVVTVQFQLVVAACNALLTLPVLIIVGLHHWVGLLLMIFVSGMVPVVGNFVAGAVLTALAYQARGIVGAAVLVALTFVLHKMESYYLNPRLASRHVHLPGFVLIISLLCWEHLLGFPGLFLSFPFLFVANRIQKEYAQHPSG
jgi:predicted PurR-regulated permease PerM